jgi:hypothetical protein
MPDTKIEPVNLALVGLNTLRDALGVQATARRELTEAQIATGIDDFMRFVKDPRMRSVWVELARQKPVWVELARQAPSDASQRLIAAWSFLIVAHSLSKLGDNVRHVLSTKAERRGAIKKLINLVPPCIGSLRGQAVYFREEYAAGRCDQGQAWAQAMEQAANYREHRLVESVTPRPLPTITRIRCDRRLAARVYAILLANEARRLYGQPLRGTVAITTTVGLRLPAGEEVTIAEVRKWCEPPKPSRGGYDLKRRKQIS